MTELPPPPLGVRDATAADVLRSALRLPWILISRVVTRRTTPGQWVVAAAILVVLAGASVTVARSPHVAIAALAIVGVVALVACAQRVWGGSRARRYSLEDGSAILTVTASRRGWTMTGHTRAIGRPGSGRRLQELMVPTILEAADAANVAVRMRAASPRLAELYSRMAPGQLESRPAFPYGIQLYRRTTSERRRPTRS